MDIVERWSERIAQRVSPDEIDFAAAVGAAYAEGGRARENLFARKGVQPGAFGPGASAADLPAILHALAGARTAIMTLLRGPYVSDALIAGTLLTVARRDRGHGPAGPVSETATVAAPADQLPASELHAIEQALDQLSNRLQGAGFTEQRADQLAHALLAELMTEAPSAASFIDALTAAPALSRRRGPGPRGPRSGRRDNWPRPGIKGP